MMVFELYCLFALTTAFTAHLELVSPVVAKELLEKGKLDNSKVIIFITFFLLNTLAAPLVFLSCVIPEWGIRFRETLQTALFKEE